MKLFKDRTHAGQRLAEALMAYKNHPNALILALPRGGVPVAFEVAQQLHLPLDVWLVRKLGTPSQEELAMGAISMEGNQFLNQGIINSLHISETVINQVIAREKKELSRRNNLYRQNRPVPDIANKTIILIDDGIATGASMRVAIDALKRLKPARVIVAVPVAAVDTCEILNDEVDELICLQTPEPFYGVGGWYEDFSQTTDEDVAQLLNVGQVWNGSPPAGG